MEIVSDIRAILRTETRDSARWNAIRDFGTPVIVSYHFSEGSELPSRGALDFSTNGVATLSSSLRAGLRDAFDVFEAATGIVFVENPEGPAMINLFGVDGAPFGGRASYPIAATNQTGEGELIINTADVTGTTGFNFELFLHEIGHATGLEHPFEGPFILRDDLDNTGTTLMSYTSIGTPMTELGPLDLEALEYLYGDPVDRSGQSFRFQGDVFRAEGSAGRDEIIGVGGPNRIEGKGGKDDLIGRDDADTIDGGNGNDKIYGLDGEDRLIGGKGNDKIFAGDDPRVSADDDVRDFDGNVLLGGAERDMLQGGLGDDLLKGGGGKDRLFGDTEDSFGGDDTLSGGGGDDTLDGGRGNDRVRGDKGDDTLSGGASGVDTLQGGKGDDLLRAIEPDARFLSDILDGGPGNDTLVASAGFDTFAFVQVARGDRDVIRDFDLLRDSLDFGSKLDPDAATFASTGGGADTRVEVPLSRGEITLIFNDVTASELEANWDRLIA